jgi:cytochrome c-type biogenesis protein CcmH
MICTIKKARAMVRVLLAILLTTMSALYAGNTVAAIDAYPFPNEELQHRYNSLIDELRCPQCLNTNLAGSDAMIAQDLRREVHRMLIEGKSDQQILDFMYERYGDFILYRPRLGLSTVVLWFGPVLLLVISLLLLIRFVSRAGRKEARVLTAEEQARLDSLLVERED